MVGLVDIAPAVERVTVRGHEVEVTGISAAGVASLLGRFPDLRRMVSGRDVAVEDLLSLSGEIVGAILAAGTGQLGDGATEAAAGRLGIDEQADLLAAIVRATLPQGVGPFVEKLTAVGAAVGIEEVPGGDARSPTAPATRSPSPRKR